MKEARDVHLVIGQPAPEDAVEVVRLSRLLYPERPEHMDLWQTDGGSWYTQDRWIAKVEGRVAGYGAFQPEAGYEPEARIWRISLGVDPNWRCQGIGQRLLTSLLGTLSNLKARQIRIRIKEPALESCDFLGRRGFQPYQRMVHLTQELQAAPSAGGHPLVEPLIKDLRFLTLREAQGQDPDLLSKLHALYCAACADIPSGEVNRLPTREAYVQSLSDPLLLPDCFWLAARDGEYVGLSYAARLAEEPGVLGHRFTGVRREHRGKGVATALKLLVQEYAHEHGFHRIETATLESNLPMLAVNRGLGFTVAYRSLRLRLDLPN